MRGCMPFWSILYVSCACMVCICEVMIGLYCWSISSSMQVAVRRAWSLKALFHWRPGCVARLFCLSEVLKDSYGRSGTQKRRSLVHIKPFSKRRRVQLRVTGNTVKESVIYESSILHIKWVSVMVETLQDMSNQIIFIAPLSLFQASSPNSVPRGAKFYFMNTCNNGQFGSCYLTLIWPWPVLINSCKPLTQALPGYSIQY
jgi:hypothetical protein